MLSIPKEVDWLESTDRTAVYPLYRHWCFGRPPPCSPLPPWLAKFVAWFQGRPRGWNEVSIQDIWSCRCRSCSRRLHRISLGWFRLVFRLLGSERIRSLNLCQGCSKCLSPTIIYKIIVKYKRWRMTEKGIITIISKWPTSWSMECEM